jgi:hypothetical protein
MESRTRLALVLGGLPPPRSHVTVQDGEFVARLDLAYDDIWLGIEYMTAHTISSAAFAADLTRHNRLQAMGWTVLRFTAADVLRHPERLVARVRTALNQRRHAA